MVKKKKTINRRKNATINTKRSKANVIALFFILHIQIFHQCCLSSTVSASSILHSLFRNIENSLGKGRRNGNGNGRDKNTLTNCLSIRSGGDGLGVEEEKGVAIDGKVRDMAQVNDGQDHSFSQTSTNVVGRDNCNLGDVGGKDITCHNLEKKNSSEILTSTKKIEVSGNYCANDNDNSTLQDQHKLKENTSTLTNHTNNLTIAVTTSPINETASPLKDILNLIAQIQRKQEKLKETWEEKRRSRIRKSSTSPFFTDETGSNNKANNNIGENISRLTNEITKAKRIFFNRISLISANLVKSESDAAAIDNVTDHTTLFIGDNDGYDDEITHQSDIMRPGRQMFVVTTAAIPWFTGTAVNPLLRSAYLCRLTKEVNQKAYNSRVTNETLATEKQNAIFSTDNETDVQQSDQKENVQMVTLVIPWLELEDDRLKLYGHNHLFSTPEDQELYIRAWLRDEADMPQEADPKSGLKIIFYPARYHEGLKSIFAMGDICSLIPSQSSDDVCILEEPEHLNWYRAPSEDVWTKKFNFVVGIIHTNYVEYASAHYSGLWTAPAIGAISSAMVRAYCHIVIKLSDTLQTFAPEKERTCNVHGVRLEFLREGRRRAGYGNSEGNESALSLDSDYIDMQRTDVRTETLKVDSMCQKIDDRTGRHTISYGHEVDASTASSSTVNPDESSTKAYFIGKILWAKGLDKLLEMQKFYKQCTGDYFAIDIYGSGPEEKEIQRAFHGRRHLHRQKRGRRYKSNESQSIYVQEQEDTSELRNDTDFNNAHVDDDDDDDEDWILSDEESDDLVDPACSDNLGEKDENQLNNEKIEIQIKSSFAAKLSKTIKSTKESIKSTTEGLEFDLPKSLYEWRRKPIPATFPGRVDHATLKGDKYKVFVNPSVSEVLCTTTAEALAMGKFVIIPKHPSNQFFLQFPNCLAYGNKLEFVANLRWALSHDPEPLTTEEQLIFTWEAATDRLIHSAVITRRDAKERHRLGTSKLDERIAWFHNEIGKGSLGDTLRKVLGAGPVADQVKYETDQRQAEENENEVEKDTRQSTSANDDVNEGNNDEGSTEKVPVSSLATSFRSSFLNGIIMPGSSTFSN